MNTIMWVVMTLIGETLIYIIYKKRESLFNRRRIEEGFKMLSSTTELPDVDKGIKDDVFKIIQLYKKCDFSEKSINFRNEIEKLLFDYICISNRACITIGILNNTTSNQDSSEDMEELSSSEQKKGQLEAILSNLFMYINDNESDLD